MINNKQKCFKQSADTTDEEGLRLAYEAKDGLYQHYKKTTKASTKSSQSIIQMI